MKRRGYTLAEVLLGMALLAVTVLTVVGLFLAAHGSGQLGLENAQASQLGTAELRRFKAMPYQVLEGYATTPPPAWELEQNGQKYALELRVEALPDPDDQVLNLRLQLDWEQKKAQSGVGLAALRAASTRLVLNSCVAPEGAL